MAKSSVPVLHGFTNPAYGRVKQLCSQSADIRSMIAKVQEIARSSGNRNGSDFKALLRACKDAGIQEQFNKTLRAYQNVPDSRPQLGAPPNTNEVYGRFSKGTRITDIGSGNMSKLQRYTGNIKITAVDPNLSDAKLVLRKIRKPVEELLPFAPDIILTSFMSLCQLPTSTQEQLSGYDGLHMIPDHVALLALGAAERCEGKVLVTTFRGQYSDFPVNFIGAEVETGYRLFASFRERNIIVTTGNALMQPYQPLSDCVPATFTELDLQDISPKMDGVFHELEIVNNQAYLVDRAGLQSIGPCEGFSDHMCLHVEEMENIFVLLRIVSFRGYIPPHAGSVLRYFTKRVRLKINDKPLCGPTSWHPGENVHVVEYTDGDPILHSVPTDGVVSRVKGKDLYCKSRWTVDLNDLMEERLRHKIGKQGLRLEWQPVAGLHEYTLDRIGDTVKLGYVRPRTDKRKPTTIDTVLYLLELPTLEEMEALA